MVGLAAVGRGLGMVGERTAPTAMLLLAEPGLLALASYAALALVWAGRFRLALAAVLGTVLAALGVRRPAEALVTRSDAPAWTETLRGCALLPNPPRSPVRVLTWTVAPTESPPDLPALLAEVSPDLVVLVGTADEALAATLELELEGEALVLPADPIEGSMILAARGAFQSCGTDADRWTEALSSGAARSARMVVTFPEVRDVGVVPLVAARLDGPGTVGEWAGWPDRLLGGASRVAATAAAIGSDRLVLAGDLSAPATFRGVAGLLRGARLLPMFGAPSWPARLGPLPFLPLHALDQVWAGSAWTGISAGEWSGQGLARTPVVVDLSPRSGTARGP